MLRLKKWAHPQHVEILFAHPQPNVRQSLEQRLQAVIPQVHFLDEPDGLVPPANESLPGCSPFAESILLAYGNAIVLVVKLEQVAQRR